MRAAALLLVVAVVAILAVGAFLVTTPSGTGGRVVVRDGDSLAAVADRLAAAGIIRSALALRAFARFRAADDRGLQPGTYDFRGGESLDAVLAVLARGPTLTTVTVPEGLTVREVAALLAGRGLGTEADFLCLADDPEFLVAAGVPGPRLEGYLFPDTYRFPPDATPGDVLATMVRRFHDQFGATHHRRAAARGMTVDQVVTLASIVEKETGVASERPLVAGVFANRLRRGMPLQSDPTVIYGLPDFRGDLTRADLASPSPYNTYAHPGLPPGPIANPGLAALEAVLAPADTPYLYFVSRNDGSHAFSATLAEHNRAVGRYQRGGR